MVTTVLVGSEGRARRGKKAVSGRWSDRRGQRKVGGGGGVKKTEMASLRWRAKEGEDAEERRRRSMEAGDDHGDEKRRKKGRGRLCGGWLVTEAEEREEREVTAVTTNNAGERKREGQRNGVAVVGLTSPRRRATTVLDGDKEDEAGEGDGGWLGSGEKERCRGGRGRKPVPALDGDPGEDVDEERGAVTEGLGGARRGRGRWAWCALGAVLHCARLRARGHWAPRVVSCAHVARSGHSDVTSIGSKM